MIYGTASSSLVEERRPSLRARKKLATRLSIRRITLELISEHGFQKVTVEDIAEAAEISPRTFFNYFPSKEAALFGAEPGRTEAMRARLIARPAEEAPLVALAAVVSEEAARVADELDELGGEPSQWLKKMKAALVDPHLRAAHASHTSAIERSVAEGLAERLGVRMEEDGYPLLLASVAMGALRAALMCWVSLGGAVPLKSLVTAAFSALESGLALDCDFRTLVSTERSKTELGGLPGKRDQSIDEEGSRR